MLTPRARRWTVASTVAALTLTLAVPAAGAQTDGRTPDLATWCQARVDAETAFFSEDEQAIEEGLDALAASAPDDIADDNSVVTTLLAKRGEKAFDSPKFRRALGAVDAYVAENCGFTNLEIGAIDYEFTGIPETVPAGNATITIVNEAPKEEHEVIVVRLNDDVTLTAEELLELPEKKSEKLITFKGAAFAPAGESSATVTNLDPGRYVVGCFVPVGGKKKGAPHFTRGMFGEFEVVAA